MNITLKKAFVFCLGMALGGLIGWILIKLAPYLLAGLLTGCVLAVALGCILIPCALVVALTLELVKWVHK